MSVPKSANEHLWSAAAFNWAYASPPWDFDSPHVGGKNPA